MLKVGDVEFSKNRIFCCSDDAINFSFCCRHPGDKNYQFFGVEIMLHIFSCDIKSSNMGYFILSFKNWSMIDYTGFRDFSRRILS